MHINLEDYLTASRRNLLQMSRTARGNLDLSASADKQAKMASGITGEKAAGIAAQNYDKAISFAYDQRHQSFANSSELRGFFEKLSSIVNDGILQSEYLIRNGADSTKYPYTRVADLEKAMEEFYRALYAYIDRPENPKITAAFIEWNIDLRGHFFGDGCGKSAKACSSWLLMRHNAELPDYTGNGRIEDPRAVYYGLNPSYIRTDNPLRDSVDFFTFAIYYMTLY